MPETKTPEPTPKPASNTANPKNQEDHEKTQKALDDAAPQTDGRPGP